MRTYGFASGVTLGSDWIGGGLSSFIDSPLFVSFGSSVFCSASGSIAGGLSTGADGAALLPSDSIMQQPLIKDNDMTWNTISIYSQGKTRVRVILLCTRTLCMPPSALAPTLAQGCDSHLRLSGRIRGYVLQGRQSQPIRA